MSEKVKLLELYQIQQLSKNKKKFIRNNVKLFQKKSKKSCSQPKTSANSSETSQANNNTNINCFVKTSTFMNDSNLLQKQSITEKVKLLELYQIQQLSKNKKKFIRNNLTLF